MDSELKPCRNCGLLADDHAGLDICVQALRDAMLKQREAAAKLSFDLSTRYLAALEELALGIDAGVPYKVRLADEQILQVHHRDVAGIFAAILRKFRELGDWSPLREAEQTAEQMRHGASHLLGILESILAELEEGPVSAVDEALVDKGRSVAESARQLGVRPPDLGRS